MSILDSIIDRVYKCSNKECGGIISYQEKASDDWKTQCPFCEQETLLIESADLGLSIVIDRNKPKTIGSLAEKNRIIKEKDGTIEQKRRPFWRKKDKPDYNILKNPKKYVETGTI